MTWTPERHARNRELLAALPERPWHATDEGELFWTLVNFEIAPAIWVDLLSAETDASEAVAQFCADAPLELQSAMDEIERVTAQRDILLNALCGRSPSIADAAKAYRTLIAVSDTPVTIEAIADALDAIGTQGDAHDLI